MAGTVTEKVNTHGENMKTVVMTCVADAADGSYPDTAFTEDCAGWFLEKVITNPGTTGPTDNSDFVLEDANGNDVLIGQGQDAIDNAANNVLYPIAVAEPTRQLIVGSLTQKITNNSVNSAVVVITYIFTR